MCQFNGDKHHCQSIKKKLGVCWDKNRINNKLKPRSVIRETLPGVTTLEDLFTLSLKITKSLKP